MEIPIANNYRVGYWDLETDDSHGEIRIGEDRIISCSIIDDLNTEEWFLASKTNDNQGEIELLAAIISKLEEYDIILGWNTAKFDLPVLRDRWRKLTGQYWFCKHLRSQDALILFRNAGIFQHQQIRRWALDFVANAFGFEGKVPMPFIEGRGRTKLAWDENRALLEEYNTHDVVMVRNLAQKFHLVDLLIQQSVVTGFPVMRFSVGGIVDSMLLREAATRRNKGELAPRFPSSFHRIEMRGIEMHQSGTWSTRDMHAMREQFWRKIGFVKPKIKGPLVLDPKPGLQKDVYVIDFAAMYPSTIIACNKDSTRKSKCR
jgi:DNA polymerase elongation subunit (family B)